MTSPLIVSSEPSSPLITKSPFIRSSGRVWSTARSSTTTFAASVATGVSCQVSLLSNSQAPPSCVSSRAMPMPSSGVPSGLFGTGTARRPAVSVAARSYSPPPSSPGAACRYQMPRGAAMAVGITKRPSSGSISTVSAAGLCAQRPPSASRSERSAASSVHDAGRPSMKNDRSIP